LSYCAEVGNKEYRLHDKLLSKVGRMEVATEQIGAYMAKGLPLSFYIIIATYIAISQTTGSGS